MVLRRERNIYIINPCSFPPKLMSETQTKETRTCQGFWNEGDATFPTEEGGMARDQATTLFNLHRMLIN